MARPAVLQLLGHELRWQIVGELLKSDLKVGELVAETREAQSLVSYHLRLLRKAGLVHERRSSADGRDVYYSLDRRAATAGLIGAITAINPGAEQLSAGGLLKDSPTDSQPASILFLCTGNSARSQIAETILRQIGGRRVRVRSAGTHPVGVHPQVHHVLAARDIPTSNLRSKSIAEFWGQSFEYVVSLCDIARAEPIRLNGKPQRVHWSIPDPAAAPGGPVAVVAAFERATDQIKVRVEDFYADLRTRWSAA